MTEAPVRCLKCGLLLAGRSLEGLCAACLLESSLEQDPELEQSSVDVEWLNRRGLGPSRPTTVKGRRFGEYELEGEVARGGMGIIYRARHLRLNRVVALKMILPGPLATPDFLARFQNEARAAATLDHANVVSIHEVGEVEGQPYYTMRLIEGLDLAKELARGGALSNRRAAEIMAWVARAVHYAHQRGVLHRDLKPANILLDGEGRPHVTDFGLAKLVEEDQGLTHSSASLGTPSYMSPEQAAGHARDVTTATDIYSLGAILFEALTGERLFAAPTPLGTIKQVLEQEARPASSVNRSVPADLDTICLKCLEKEPHRRYRTALEMAEDLEHWLAGEPIRARPVRLVERIWLWCRRRPALAGLAGASLAVLMVVSALAVWRVRVAREQEDLERYAANISLADSAIKAGSMDRALDYLERCPEDQRNWEWGRLLFECFQDVSSIPAHTKPPRFLDVSLIKEVVFNDPGDRLATRGQDGSLAIWNPVEGRALFRLGDETNQVSSASFRPGHSQIAIGWLDGSVGLVESDSGRVVLLLRGAPPGPADTAPDPVFWVNVDPYDQSSVRDRLRRRPQAVTGLSWDPTGRQLAVVTAGGRVSVKELSDGTREWEWASPDSAEPVSAWFAPKGAAVVIQRSGQALRLDAATGTELGGIRWDSMSDLPASLWLYASVVSPDGRRVVLIDRQHQAKLLGEDGAIAELGTLVKRNANAPLTAFFSPDGEWFCTTGDVGTARVFRADDGERVFATPDTVYGGAFSSNGELLAVFGEERGVHLWDVHHRWELRTLRGHLSSIVAVSFDPRGQLVATASREGEVKIWGALHSGQVLLGDTLTSSSGYSPDGRWLATAPMFRGIRLWEASTGRLRWRVPSRTQTAYNLAFSADGQRLYTAGSDRCVRILHVTDGSPAGMLRGHRWPVWIACCSPDGSYVATGDHGGIVKIWDAQTGVELRQLEAHPARVWSLQFDAASRLLVSAGAGRPKLWEVASGALLAELDDQKSGVWFATFVPMSRLVAAACMDNRTRFWEVPSGRLVKSWNNQTQGTAYWDYSPDGSRFALPVADVSTLGLSVPKLEIWDASQGRALLNLDVHRESVYAVAFDRSGQRRIVTSSMDTTVRQWEAFPWRDADFPEPPGRPLMERAKHYARKYWLERLQQTLNQPSVPRMTEEPPLPPGIPEWERDRWPMRDAQASPLQVNLDSAYTGVLDACMYPSWYDTDYDDDLSELPSGLRRFGGVLFDVRGVVWLRPRLPNPADTTLRAVFHDFPERVEGIGIRRHFRRLHVLHAASTDAYLGASPASLKNLKGGPPLVAAYVLRFADGTRHEHEVVYGRDLRNWWWGARGDEEAGVGRATVAWEGANPASRRYEAKVRLFLSTFENPKPNTEVTSVDFVSKRAFAAPFLVAMTLEE